MTDDSESETKFRTPFGIEVDARESHLAALPGKRAWEWIESIKRATEVFNGNTVALQEHLTQFVGTAIHVDDVPDDFVVEANRLLHNYVTAMGTLRDIQRAIHRQVWPEPSDDDNNRPCPTCGQRPSKQTKWQVAVWEPHVAKMFGDDAIRFLADLRVFSAHYSIPPVTLTTLWHSKGGGPMQWRNIVALKRDELMKYNGWSSAARRYITTQDGDVEFMPVIALYSTQVRAFADWFWRLVEAEVRADLATYIAKTNEYIYWRHVDGTWGRHGTDGRRVQYRKTAEARRVRAEGGTSGWRLIAPDENGEWVVGESDWPPLPRGPR